MKGELERVGGSTRERLEDTGCCLFKYSNSFIKIGRSIDSIKRSFVQCWLGVASSLS